MSTLDGAKAKFLAKFTEVHIHTYIWLPHITLVRVYPLKPQVTVPKNPVISNLNTLLHDIYVREIALKDKEFKKYYNVFETIFFELHNRMKEVDEYYKQYSTTVQYAGSHYDKLRINKPDEFDMDIGIDLPVDTKVKRKNPAKSDVVIEPIAPGFVQLKMGTEFRNLPNRGVDWKINQTAYSWLDNENYLLRSLFMNWFRSVVDKAMNTFDEAPAPNGRPYMHVNGIPYTLRLSASGPAITLIIEDTSRGFRLDVDLVPAIQFPEDRYPITKKYRKVPKRCKKENFIVVPKPMKGSKRTDSDRSWRLGMHLQEKDLMYDTMHMKQAIRLIKKLRDSLGMDKIASYYIKTMFFHEAIERDPEFWSANSPAELFMIMVQKFHQYLEDMYLPYFWNEGNNLIGDIDESTLIGYANKLEKLIKVLNDPSQYKLVAKFLLTESQFKEYNRKYLHI